MRRASPSAVASIIREGTGTIHSLLGLIDFVGRETTGRRATHLRESLALYRELDSGWLVGNLMAQFAGAGRRRSGSQSAPPGCWGALSALSEAVSMPADPAGRGGPRRRRWPGASGARRRARSTAEQQVGRRMSLDEASAEALAIDVAAPRPTLRPPAHPYARSTVVAS